MDDTVAAAAIPAQADHRFAAVARDAVCRPILSRRAARRQRLPDRIPGGAPTRPPSAAHPATHPATYSATYSAASSAFPAAAHCASIPAVQPGGAENTPTRHLTTRNPQ
ncbi:MAG: hypothetical protein RBT86_08765 [Azospira sp.]|jgi:hypothetical protein|nr:hypothetical protein [Azospira sp.]